MILWPSWRSGKQCALNRVPTTRGDSHRRCSHSCDQAYRHILTLYAKEGVEVLRYNIGSRASLATIVVNPSRVQGVVTYVPPVEAFATGIKTESSDQRSFKSGSRDQDEL